MGVARRWIRQLLGLKKPEKVVILEEEEKKSGKSVEVDRGVSKNEPKDNVDTEFEDANWQWDMDPKNAAQLPLDRRKESDFQSAAHSPSSPEEQTAAQIEQESGEGWATPDVREVFEPEAESGSTSSCSSSSHDPSSSHSPVQLDRNMQQQLAARCIQTAMRGLLVRRAFRVLKGVTRLQALMKGPTLKRQTAIALRCIQALIKVQARSRAKHVLTALESQAVQRKLLQQLEHEAPVKKTEKPEDTKFVHDGWCNKVGSARQIQANMMKRKEAAAKREKAKAYALARQWQAGIRQQPQQPPQPQPQLEQPEAAAGFLSEQIDWDWSWLERWKAVRPWEADLLREASIRERTKSPNSASTSPSLSKERRLSTGSGKSSPRLSNSPSPRKLANAQENPTTPVSSRSPRTPGKSPFREGSSRPTTVSRSFSTPRERATHSDNQEENKRLSLPGTVHGARVVAQTAVKSPRTQSSRVHSPRTQSPRTPQKSTSFGTKLNEVKTSKLSR